MAKDKIHEAGANTAPASFSSAAISATGAVLKSFARVLDRGTAAVGEAAPAALKAKLAKKKRAAPKRKTKAAKKVAKKKPAKKRAAAKKKRPSSRRKR
jgi:hypothetical protein